MRYAQHGAFCAESAHAAVCRAYEDGRLAAGRLRNRRSLSCTDRTDGGRSAAPLSWRSTLRAGFVARDLDRRMRRYDLHCHSTRSDGLLAPADVVRRAASRGVDVLALTDHDELAGLAEAQEAARETVAGVRLRLRAVGELGGPDDPRRRAAHRSGARRPRRRARSDPQRAREPRAAQSPMRSRQPGIPGAWEGARRSRHQRAADLPHALRAIPRRGRSRARDEGRVQALSRAGPPRLRRARMGDAAGRDRLDPRGGRRRGPGASGTLQGVVRAACNGCSAISATRAAMRSRCFRPRIPRRRSRSSRRSPACSACAARWAPTITGRAKAALDLGDLPPLPAGVTPVWTNW